MEPQTSSSGGGLKDAIVTLPYWGLGLIAAMCLGALSVAVWLIFKTDSDEVKGQALQLFIVLVPLGSGLIAAIAIRQTSTKQIDRLVSQFLEKTVLQRFQVWCQKAEKHAQNHVAGFPFSDVRMVEPPGARSYAYYSFTLDSNPEILQVVGVKANVFNFEVFFRVELHMPKEEVDAISNGQYTFSPAMLADVQKLQFGNHPMLKNFGGFIHGTLSEGYDIKIEFVGLASELIGMHVSIRQKLRENFLASPYLKRYFAEDAAIATNVAFSELRRSGYWAVPKGI